MNAIIPETSSYRRPPETSMMTFGGWARSGKGTSVGYVARYFRADGLDVRVIDQGLKFRSMAKVALLEDAPVDDVYGLSDFLCAPDTQRDVFHLLGEVADMDKASVDMLLYDEEVAEASGKVGKTAVAHDIATTLLRQEVEQAVEEHRDVVLVDGRAMEKYARQYQEEGLTTNVLNWYFTCDPFIAARRSLGIFTDTKQIDTGDRLKLFEETARISDRNRSDTLRTVDPMREPEIALELDLLKYGRPDYPVPFNLGQTARRKRSVSVNTSYTNSIEQMTRPVTAISALALRFAGGPISHEAVGIRLASPV